MAWVTQQDLAASAAMCFKLQTLKQLILFFPSPAPLDLDWVWRQTSRVWATGLCNCLFAAQKRKDIGCQRTKHLYATCQRAKDTFFGLQTNFHSKMNLCSFYKMQISVSPWLKRNTRWTFIYRTLETLSCYSSRERGRSSATGVRKALKS